MNYGLYMSASGVLTGMHRMDVAANNLANVSTVAFKPDMATTMQRDPARVEDNLMLLDSNRLLERLGAGALASPTRTRFDPAPLKQTNNPLDVAIEKEGFFVVRSPQGAGDESLRFTRDGRLTLDSQGRLVMSATGLPVVGDNNQPITLDPSQAAQIVGDGAVRQGGRQVARLQVVTLPDAASLRKVGENLYRAEPGAAEQRRPTEPLLRAGAVERSAVNPVDELSNITKASGAVQNNTRMIDMHDQIMDLAINTFASVG